MTCPPVHPKSTSEPSIETASTSSCVRKSALGEGWTQPVLPSRSNNLKSGSGPEIKRAPSGKAARAKRLLPLRYARMVSRLARGRASHSATRQTTRHIALAARLRTTVAAPATSYIRTEVAITPWGLRWMRSSWFRRPSHEMYHPPSSCECELPEKAIFGGRGWCNRPFPDANAMEKFKVIFTL